MEKPHMNEQTAEPATELERTNEHSQVEVPLPRALTKDRLMAGANVNAIVPRSFEEVWRIAQLAVKSQLAPRDIKTPERAAIAIMHGLEIGLPPMAALQRIAVINGRPCVWGDAVPGIALSTNQLVEWSEDFTGTGDDLTAVCRVVRKMGLGFNMTKVATFSVADAKKADLWDERAKVKRKNYQTNEMYEAANDSPWYCYPKRMLQMRARVAFRDLFADAMCGLYIAEELVGRNADAQMRDVTPSYERIENPLGGPDTSNEAAKINVAQDAPQEPASASEPESNGGQPNGKKVAPAPPAGQGEAVFEKPYSKQSGTAYFKYAREWISPQADKEAARARWTKERTIRNNLGSPLSEDELTELQTLMGKVGT
jgi:hypothetical protein